MGGGGGVEASPRGSGRSVPVHAGPGALRPPALAQRPGLRGAAGARSPRPGRSGRGAAARARPLLRSPIPGGRACVAACARGERSLRAPGPTQLDAGDGTSPVQGPLKKVQYNLEKTKPRREPPLCERMLCLLPVAVRYCNVRRGRAFWFLVLVFCFCFP